MMKGTTVLAFISISIGFTPNTPFEPVLITHIGRWVSCQPRLLYRHFADYSVWDLRALTWAAPFRIFAGGRKTTSAVFLGMAGGGGGGVGGPHTSPGEEKSTPIKFGAER